MVKINNLFFLFFFLFGITAHAQKVSNVTFRQEQSNIIVSYDLETKTPSKISLFISKDDGKTWQGPLKKVSGDVGFKIASGNQSITWNVLEEFDELRGDKIKFQVRADAQLRTDTPLINTVKIGTQQWTVKNLDVSQYRNGDIIPEVKDPREWSKLKTGAWCYYNNDPENGKVYGKLYNWYAVNDPRGLAPEGFHIPSDSEWKILIDYSGGRSFAGGKMKEQGTKHWKSQNYDASNNTGFTGLPGGFCANTGIFGNIEDYGYWWTHSKFDTTSALARFLCYNDGIANSYTYNKALGFSVRCLKD